MDVSSLVKELADHWGDVTTGAVGFGIVAHAVNTFPTPKNVYGQWALGIVQFTVGQRVVAKNTLAGKDTEAQAVQR